MTDSRETERFNFWCKGCGGVVYGFRSEHQHTELRPTVGRTRKAKARKVRVVNMRQTLRHFREWHADHFGDFSPEINAELLCLDNDAAFALDDDN